MNPMLLRALLARLGPAASRFVAGSGGLNTKAGMISPPDVPNLPTVPFAQSDLAKSFSDLSGGLKGLFPKKNTPEASGGADEAGFISAYPPASPSDRIKEAFKAMASQPTQAPAQQPSAQPFDPFAGAALPPHQGSLVGQSPQPQPAFDPNSIPGFNPSLPNMANPQMSSDSMGPGMQARGVPDGNGGMMNDFYTQGPSASGPDLVQKFMSYMHSKNPGTA